MNRSKMQVHVFAVVLILTLVFASVASAAPKDGPVVNLSVDQSEYDSGQDVFVTVSISNPTKHTVRILKWFTPVDGMEEPLFSVSRDGKQVGYTGPIFKRPDATGKDYISLKAGESVSAVVNLADYYDLSEAGNFEVSYNVASEKLFDEKGNSFKGKATLTSEPVSFKGNGGLGKGKPAPPPPPPPGSSSFNSCTTDQQSLIVAARDQAKIYAANSESYLTSNTQGPRYSTWFGSYSSSRYNTVKSNFIAISDAMDNAGVTFNCKCKQPYYAYVYPNEPYTIYICKVFWQAPLSGTDSKAGTLIHEMSHFNVVAGTDDVVYGQSGAMNLATTDPDAAITNADSHEYFAENTPSLP